MVNDTEEIISWVRSIMACIFWLLFSRSQVVIKWTNFWQNIFTKTPSSHSVKILNEKCCHLMTFWWRLKSQWKQGPENLCLWCKSYKFKFHIFWEGHKILRNLHLTFDCMYCSQKFGEDFAKFCCPSQFIWTLKVILENSIISSAKKIGRPILVNLPTYYVRFSSDYAQPTYLPKIGRH